MIVKRILLAALLVLAGFAFGVALSRRAARPRAIPVADSRAQAILPASTDGACKSDLVNAKAQLAICLALRTAPVSSAPLPPLRLDEMDEETARLVRTHTTNTEVVIVQTADRRFGPYGPGKWPPDGGPERGSHIIARSVDGGLEFFRDGGVRELVTNLDIPKLCRCPRNPLDGGTEGG